MSGRLGRKMMGREQANGLDLRVQLGALELPNPIVAASGTFGHGDELAGLCDPSRLGAVTTKSQAAFAWSGNPAPRLHPAAAGMVNAVGLQGHGVEDWIAHDLPALRSTGARVIASLWGRSVAEYATAATLLAPALGELVAVEVNLSCPNLEHGDGSRVPTFSHDPQAAALVLQAVCTALATAHAPDPARAVPMPVPVFAKLSPGVSGLVEVAAAAVDAGATGLTLVNTMPAFIVDAGARRPALGSSGGGLSGPALKPIALRAVHDVSRALPGVPIIGTGGVSTGTDAVEMLLAGASAVGVGTATFVEPRATLRILDELASWCVRQGIERVSELTAALLPPKGSS